MDVIVSFCFQKGFGVESNSFGFASVVFLGQDCTSGECQNIHLKRKRFGQIGLMERWVGSDNVDQGVEGLLTLGSPHEWVVLLGEFYEWSGDSGIVWYERSLVTQNFKDTPDFFYFVH